MLLLKIALAENIFSLKSDEFKTCIKTFIYMFSKTQQKDNRHIGSDVCYECAEKCNMKT